MEMYPIEKLDSDEDDGTMPANVAELSSNVVGHKIVKVSEGVTKRKWWGSGKSLILELDNGKRVSLVDSADCCAYTELESFLIDPANIDHVISGIGTKDGYTRWFIYADMGPILEMRVGWSCGNPFYYAYGFEIIVEEKN